MCLQITLFSVKVSVHLKGITKLEAYEHYMVNLYKEIRCQVSTRAYILKGATILSVLLLLHISTLSYTMLPS